MHCTMLWLLGLSNYAIDQPILRYSGLSTRNIESIYCMKSIAMWHQTYTDYIMHPYVYESNNTANATWCLHYLQIYMRQLSFGISCDVLRCQNRQCVYTDIGHNQGFKYQTSTTYARSIRPFTHTCTQLWRHRLIIVTMHWPLPSTSESYFTNSLQFYHTPLFFFFEKWELFSRAEKNTHHL